jgi:ketosteroid isomerase-like protein
MERLRRSCQAFNVTQKTDLDLWATDIEYIQTADVGAGETVPFEELNVEPERFFDLGNRVLAFVRLRGRARRGGVPIDAPFAHLATFEGSQITHWHAYARREEGLGAVELREKAMSAESVDILRAGFDAFNRGDYDSWVGAFAEDVEVHDLADTPDTGVFHGHAGVREWLAKLQVAFGDGFRFEPTSFRESRGVVVATCERALPGWGAASQSK